MLYFDSRYAIRAHLGSWSEDRAPIILPWSGRPDHVAGSLQVVRGGYQLETLGPARAQSIGRFRQPADALKALVQSWKGTPATEAPTLEVVYQTFEEQVIRLRVVDETHVILGTMSGRIGHLSLADLSVRWEKPRSDAFVQDVAVTADGVVIAIIDGNNTLRWPDGTLAPEVDAAYHCLAWRDMLVVTDVDYGVRAFHWPTRSLSWSAPLEGTMDDLGLHVPGHRANVEILVGHARYNQPGPSTNWISVISSGGERREQHCFRTRSQLVPPFPRMNYGQVAIVSDEEVGAGPRLGELTTWNFYQRHGWQAFCWSPCGRYLLSATADNLMVFAPYDGWWRSLIDSESFIADAAWLPDGTILSLTYDGVARIKLPGYLAMRGHTSP